MIQLAFILAMVSADPVAEPCRGVYFPNGSHPFVLISLKVAGDDASLRKAKTAADSIASYSFDDNADGQKTLTIGFTSDRDSKAVDAFWKQIEDGKFGALSVKPLALPMSMISADHPCFGSLVPK